MFRYIRIVQTRWINYLHVHKRIHNKWIDKRIYLMAFLWKLRARKCNAAPHPGSIMHRVWYSWRRPVSEHRSTDNVFYRQRTPVTTKANIKLCEFSHYRTHTWRECRLSYISRFANELNRMMTSYESRSCCSDCLPARTHGLPAQSVHDRSNEWYVFSE